MSPARIAHLAVAFAALAGIILSYAAGPSAPVAQPGRMLRFLSFFTILTNALAMLAAVGRALPADHRWHRLAARPGLRTALALDLSVVALIFHLLLAHMVRPGLSGWAGNLLVHQAVPMGWLLCWLCFGPHGGIDARAPLRWLVYPLLFAGWTLIHGAIGGWYPYPFMDVARFGYPAVVRNVALIGLLFFLLGHALRRVDARLARRG